MKRLLCTAVVLFNCLACKVIPKNHKEAPCYSECGMLIERDNGSVQCSAIDGIERHVLTHMDNQLCSLDKRFCMPYSCNQLFGVQIVAPDDRVTSSEIDFGSVKLRIPVSGLSVCKTKMMWVGNSGSWRHSSLVHEMAHMIQDCDGLGPETEEDREMGAGHEGWTESGLLDFIEKFGTGEL